MFKHINGIHDVRPAVAHLPEIRFMPLEEGMTLACYLVQDTHTFETAEALECRGIVFDKAGAVCSRPLHKFFNMGEKPHLLLSKLQKRDDIVAVFEKLDGSMLATAWVNGQLRWRSKKSFSSDVVKLTEAFLAQPENAPLRDFAAEVARADMTAIFELTHPLARIVVAAPQAQLRLLHVRDNVTGAYVLLDPEHTIHALVARYQVPVAPRYAGMTFDQVLASLETMTQQEGYVLQFANGDMVKLKCPWYLRLHQNVTFLRERDIAAAAVEEALDDVKGALSELGIDLAEVNAIETRVKQALLDVAQEVESTVAQFRHLDRKSFAVTFKAHPLFSLLMTHYQGHELDLRTWYLKTRLKQDFSLRVLADGALAESTDA